MKKLIFNWLFKDYLKQRDKDIFEKIVQFVNHATKTWQTTIDIRLIEHIKTYSELIALITEKDLLLNRLENKIQIIEQDIKCLKEYIKALRNHIESPKINIIKKSKVKKK